MRRGFRLGSVQGVEIVADLSLFIIAGLLTWSLYTDLDRAFPGSSPDTLLLAAIIGGTLFFASIFLHELSHSLVALRRGLGVRRIRLFVFGGVSEIEEEAETPADELAVTLAGPATSLVLGVLFVALGWPLSSVAGDSGANCADPGVRQPIDSCLQPASRAATRRRQDVAGIGLATQRR